jgi:hypothetical protein
LNAYGVPLEDAIDFPPPMSASTTRNAAPQMACLAERQLVDEVELDAAPSRGVNRERIRAATQIIFWDRAAW